MADVSTARPAVDPRRTGLKAVPTVFVPDKEEGLYAEYAEPGWFELRVGEKGTLMMLACPGCGRVSGMTVGNPKPDNGNGATWLLTGPAESPTLHPSVNCVGCCGWHGWLKNGVFVLE